MNVIQTEIEDVLIIEPAVFGDERGFFFESYNDERFTDLTGIDVTFVQDNHSMSAKPGTIRGLHFQAPPMAQDKLVRVARGRVLDIAVDIRVGSPTFGQHVSVELSDENWEQLLVPRGFAHGLVTMGPDTEVQYKVTQYYSREHDLGLRWDDPAFKIAFPWFDSNRYWDEHVLALREQVALMQEAPLEWRPF